LPARIHLSGFIWRALMQGCTRLAVKLDVLAGVFIKMVEAIGIMENQTGAALIVHPSSSRDWKQEELRPLLDQFYRGSAGYAALDKIKLVKLPWDSIGSDEGLLRAVHGGLRPRRLDGPPPLQSGRRQRDRKAGLRATVTPPV
jgi:aromatic ring hydroxylase